MVKLTVPEIQFVAVVFPAICLASEVHLYINPSDSPCPYAESCLTLEQFSETASLYSDSSKASLTLELLPGNHSLLSPIGIQKIAFLKLFSKDKNVNVMCANLAQFRLTSIATVQVTNLTFCGCGHFGRDISAVIDHESAVLSIISSNLNLKECEFHHSKQLVIYAQYCNISIYKNEFINSSRSILYTVRCNVTDNGSYYYGNSLRPGGKEDFTSVMFSLNLGYSNFSSCRFNRNGPLLFANRTKVVFNICECTKNMAKLDRVVLALDSRINLENSHFCGNIGRKNALYVLSSTFTLKNTTIIENEAHIGPVLLFSRSTLTITDIIIAGNIPRNNSVCTSFEDSTKSNIAGKLIFINNYGFLLISNSEVTFHGKTLFQNNSNFHSQLPSTNHEGGAIVCIGSTVRFIKSITFLDNYSRKNGGALSAIGSKIYAYENIVLAKNRAKNNGGGIYLFISNFICKISCTFSENEATIGDGGGIHAVDSKVYFGGECNEYHCYSSVKVSLIFRNNVAVHGGGIYFETNSELRGPKDSYVVYKIIFDNNYAHKGGKAIYVDDRTYLTTCSQHQAQCFLQALPPNYVWLDKNSIKIMGNITKTTIFGGLLHKCIVNIAFRNMNSMTGIEYLKSVTEDQDITHIITSNPVRVCFCNGTEPNYQLGALGTLNVTVQKGKEFNVSVTALDQVNHSVNASIISNLTGCPAGSCLGNNQYNRGIPAKCTNLTFNVYSSNDVEILHIIPKDQCNKNDNKKDTLMVSITFADCSCPVGFHVENSNKISCECECDPRIKPYKEQCNLTEVVRSKEGQGWIKYSNDIGFLFHPFCPYDFCLPPTTPVIIDLRLLNGSDAQCASNRTGLLCGKCKPGYSLSLSSSHCLECPEINWPWALLIITVKIIAGIVLGATILMLNLTVSVGTLNGLIFYVNVFAADSSLFLSFTEQNVFTVFLAWLNLDLGFDVCYFKGVDAITKAWLNILFPVYVIIVLLLIILISKHSSRFGEFIGRWNPVATLATLLLLSYTKLLRTIIIILSFTIITSPTGQYEHKAVWLQDASVNFLSVKHFPLSILAIAIVISGLFYTVLLFSWQWLLQLPNRRIFKWVRNTRLNLFMEANLAPYKAKYRYWYGLLLFVRMALYLGIAIETSHESVTIILVIGLIAASILLLRTFLGNNIYRNRFIGYLNSSFYYNLLSLSLARLYCQNSTSCQERASKISIALAFILFIFILTYHILRALLEVRHFRYLMASIEEILNLRKLRIRLIDHDDPRFKKIQESAMQKARVVIPTSTEVALSPSKHSTDDEASSKNKRKFSPDEGYCLRSMMQESDCTPAEQLSVAAAGEEIVLNDSLNKESVCKQKTHHKGKRWTDSSTLREPLLQD